ncbi:MAG TPA: PIN domain-containing protein [Xanthobacteraceae bacterium]|nr:PIN domain-containing protein [Xanthobacteraceae bacterium]
MPPIDFARTLRRLKPERRRARLLRRPDAEFTFAGAADLAGPPLLLDTCVYLHVLRGKTPERVDLLLRSRTLLHSAVAVAELTNRLGARLASSERERAARDKLIRVIRDIPAHRVIAPSAAMWGEAGMLAGLRARLAGFNRGQEQESLNDALILVQARAAGAIVLTENLSDFDPLQQLAPDTRVLFYRARA